MSEASPTEKQITKLKGHLQPRSVYGEHKRSEACVAELAQIAGDNSQCGHKDPRINALLLLEAIETVQQFPYPATTGRPAVYCERPSCEVEVTVDPQADTVEIKGECTAEELCLRALWQRSNLASAANQPDPAWAAIAEQGMRRNDDESMAFFCPHVSCDYSCGFSIDGVSGEAGTCQYDETRTDAS